MVNRILSLVGWLGTAMVFIAVAIRFGYPAKEQWAFYLAWGGLVCVLAYTLGQWREIAKVFARRQTRYGTLMGIRNVAAKLDAPMQVQVFAQEKDFGRFQEKLKEYEYASKKIATEYVDPEKK